MKGHRMSQPFYSSAELRWFLPAEHAQAGKLLRWFRRENQLPMLEEKQYEPKDHLTKMFVKLEKPRTDQYLIFPDTDTISVKQRSGNLEVKALVSGPRPLSVPSVGVIGRIDQWMKWSGHLIDSLNFTSEAWCAITKNRYIQKYSVDSGAIEPVSPDAHPNRGCNIELTGVHIQGECEASWNTFGFEAFGPSGRVTAILDDAVTYFFEAHGRPPVQLGARDALSYPSWLAGNFVKES